MSLWKQRTFYCSSETEKGLSQEELAGRVFVTRQAVSRWENGETTPGTETLKLLSKEFDVSINTLLGAPRQLICQCCGMPLEDATISKEPDGAFNEEYCKWCYTDGEFKYDKPGAADRLLRGAHGERRLARRNRCGRTWRPWCRSCGIGRNKCGIPDTRAHGRSRNAARFLIDCPPREGRRQR